MFDIGVYTYLRALFSFNNDEFGKVSEDSERSFSDSLLVASRVQWYLTCSNIVHPSG